MTTDLVTTEWFDSEKESRPIRFIQDQDKTVIPIQDIAQATGLRKRSLLNILDKHKDDFKDHARDVRLSTPGGYQQVRCIDRDGAMMLLFKISTGHIKREDTKLRLNLFKEWQIKKMVQPLALPAPKEPDYDAIIRKIKFVNDLHELTKWNLLELQKEVLREAGLFSLTYHIEPEQKALPPAAPPKPKDYFTSKDIGEIIGKSAHEVNMFLYQITPPLLIKDLKGEWELTEYGRNYGEARSYEPSPGYIVWRIHWKRSILGLFNKQHEEMG